ncbi:unnamed protein product [Plutella xylostella]|uniref:Elongation of very long chain fatty acids protein n=1 Tax=Plutella xylostella TaxID=51655 RepID=A0A8S4ELJ8_PLUXY|nr:unnamed protein product [Plutella xylostella]
MNGGPTGINMSIVDSYKSFMDRNSDPRTESWWMMSGPGPLITVLISYPLLLHFSRATLHAGPEALRPQVPRYVAYNVSQVLMSVYLVYEGMVAGWWNDYNFSCQPVDYSDTPKANRMAAAVWWYFFAKIVELLDTIFFVLRKKNRQISFLHLYHHTMMPICAWIGTKFLPGGHGTLLGVINSFIHIIMYTYYLISGLGPQYQKYLWWKRHVTTLQLIQFCIIFYHNFTVMFTDCNYPKFINFLLSLNASLFLYMFGRFYYVNYIKNSKTTRPDPKPVTVNGKSKDC